jgi:hypothetical protein
MSDIPSQEPEGQVANPLQVVKRMCIFSVMSTPTSRVLDRLTEDGALQGKDIADMVGVSPATVSRWSRSKATPISRRKPLSPNFTTWSTA